MPRPGKRWYHITIGTYNSWLPGDPRGFRSRDHKTHSSGDHKSPPPKGEHQGLHRYSGSASGSVVVLHKTQRRVVGLKLIETLERHCHRVLIVCIGGMHVHLLTELGASRNEAKQAIGIAKKAASQAISEQRPGRVWAKGCGVKPIRDLSHQRNTFRYIQRHAGEGVFVWMLRDGAVEG